MRSVAWLVAAGALAAGACSASAEDLSWTPSPKQISLLESKIAPPSGARPIHRYARYYAGATIAGRQVILGSWVPGEGNIQRSPKGAGSWIVQEKALPSVFDGGCAYVTLRYDVKSAQVEYVQCNGVA